MPTPDLTFGCSLSVDEYSDVPEFARRAEALGFDRVTMGEHLMDGNPPSPTVLGLPAMAAAAGATRTIRVMTGIVIAPLYDPVLLAKSVTTVDVVSGGRLDFGIGISGQRGTKIEFDAVGVSVRTRGRRTDEMLQVMKRLWTEEHVSHHGDFFDFDDVTLVPTSTQKPHPPIWVACSQKDTFTLAGQKGIGALAFTVGAPGETIGPPTCGTGPDDIGQTCISVMREAGFPMIRLLQSCRFRREPGRSLGRGTACSCLLFFLGQSWLRRV